MEKARISSLFVVVLHICLASVSLFGDDPISHWTFDEGTGTTAYDSAGDNNGTIYGAQWTTGIIDGALDFNGVNDYVDVGNDNSLKPPLPVTLSTWIKLSSLGSYQHIITLDDTTSNYYGIWFYVMAENNLALGYGDGGGRSSWNRRSKGGTTALNADTWYHIAAIVKGPTDMNLCINGVDDGGTYSGTGGSLTYSDGSSLIGMTHNYQYFLGGQVDDVRVYDRALFTEEVRDLYLEAAGPIAHWKLDEGEGDIAYDSAGDNDGTIYGAQWTDGQIGAALDFDGDDDYVDVGDPVDGSLDFGAADSFSISVWVKTAGDGQPVYKQRIESAYREGYKVRVYFEKLYFGMKDTGNNVTQIFGSTIVTNNEWHHVVAVRDTAEDKLYLYLDGTSDATPVTDTTIETLATDRSLEIGRADATVSPYLSYHDGKIDDVRVYERALSAEEVQQLYLAGAGPISHWKFDEGEGDIAYDSAGDNDGTLVGDPVWTSGQIGGALDFDGDDDYVDVGDPVDGSLDFGAADSFSISVWVKTAEDGQPVYKQRIESAYREGYKVRVYFEKLYFGMKDTGNNVTQIFGSTIVTNNEWHHVVAVRDTAEDKLYLYLDGTSDATPVTDTTIESLATSRSLEIGRADSTVSPGISYFTGKIDDVRVYERALSAEEIQQLYEYGLSGLSASESIERALEHKIASLEELQAALAEEAAALEALNELLESGDFGDLTRWRLLRAKWKIRSAMWRERLCRAGLRRTIRKLEAALALLGCEVGPQSWPEPETETDDAVIRADINQDGVINFGDFAVLMKHWLESSEGE